MGKKGGEKRQEEGGHMTKISCIGGVMEKNTEGECHVARLA